MKLKDQNKYLGPRSTKNKIGIVFCVLGVLYFGYRTIVSGIAMLSG